MTAYDTTCSETMSATDAVQGRILGRITKGFQNEVSWVTEGSYGDGVTAGSSLLLVANQIQSVRVSRNTPLGETRNIDSYDVSKFITGVRLHGVTVEYLQDRNYSSTNCLTAKAIDRTSGVLSSIAFQIGVGKDVTIPVPTWYNLKGCKARSVTINTEEDGPIGITIDWSVKDIATSTAKVVVCSDTISTAPKSFVGGAFKRGSSATWGYVVGSVSVTIDNGLQESKDIGNNIIVAADAGTRTVTGTVNVCLIDGGAGYWAEMDNASSDVVELDFGATSNDPSMRFTSAVIGSLEIPLDSTNAVVMTTVPFTGTSVVFEQA